MAPSDFSAYSAGIGNHELLNLKYQEKKSPSKVFWVYLQEENCVANKARACTSCKHAPGV